MGARGPEMIVYTEHGERVELANKPLAQGGEGAIYQMNGRSRLVAKIYLADPEQHREKIEAMVSVYPQVAGIRALEHIAWPMGALYADSGTRHFVGFGMRCMPSHRKLEDVCAYPAPADIDMSQLEKIDYLIELCRMVDALHGMGQVIGDFNTRNVLVLENGCRPGMVDVDSFHVNIEHQEYRCEVCMPGYNAPELLRAVRGTTYKDATGATFTKATDRFALALHIFRMLMNGVHPYHCVTLPDKNGSYPAPLPVDKRIEQGATPFFANVPHVKVPSFAPDISAFPAYVTDLFQRAFVRSAADPGARPTASAWCRALERYRRELAQCAADGHHWYSASVSSCPYCAAEARAKAKRASAAKTCAAAAQKPAPASGAVSTAGQTKRAAGTGCTSNTTPAPKTAAPKTASWVDTADKLFWPAVAAVVIAMIFVPGLADAAASAVGGLADAVGDVAVPLVVGGVVLYGLLS